MNTTLSCAATRRRMLLGTLVAVLAIDPDDPAEIARAEDLNRRIVERALAMGGTCTGEHGIGIGKQEFLLREHGREAIDTMWLIKQALDPYNLMNPGKVLPPS